MFGFYKTNGFTPLSCPLEMAANMFHAHYDSTDAALRPSETTSHSANGNTELCRQYLTCACATGIKVHISLVVTSETHREHSVFRISRISRRKRPHACRPLVRRTSRFNMHLVNTILKASQAQNADCHGSYQAWPYGFTYGHQASPPIITDTTTERFKYRVIVLLLWFSHSLMTLIPVVFCFFFTNDSFNYI